MAVPKFDQRVPFLLPRFLTKEALEHARFPRQWLVIIVRRQSVWTYFLSLSLSLSLGSRGLILSKFRPRVLPFRACVSVKRVACLPGPERRKKGPWPPSRLSNISRHCHAARLVIVEEEPQGTVAIGLNVSITIGSCSFSSPPWIYILFLSSLSESPSKSAWIRPNDHTEGGGRVRGEREELEFFKQETRKNRRFPTVSLSVLYVVFG